MMLMSVYLPIGVPQGVDYEQLRSLLMSLESVVTVHNLNVWALTMDRNALSVHLTVGKSPYIQRMGFDPGPQRLVGPPTCG